MADMIKSEDRTLTPKSRPRPEIKRHIVKIPGGLPLPPSKLKSVPQSSSNLPGSLATSSSISTWDTLSGPSEIKPTIDTPRDLFGLPKFSIAQIPRAPIELTGFGTSNIPSPTHLPGLSKIIIPSLIDRLPAPSGIKIPNLQTPIPLPKSSEIKPLSDAVTSRLPGISGPTASSPKDIPRPPKRPSDLALNLPSGIKHSLDPASICETGKSGNDLSSSQRTKDLHKPSDIQPLNDPKAGSSTSTPASILVSQSSTDESSPEGNLPGTSVISNPSSHSPEPSKGNEDVDPESNLHGKLTAKRSSDPTPVVGLTGSSEIKRTGDSMPAMAQHAEAKPRSLFVKLRNFVKRGLVKKKTKDEPNDEKESAGLVLEGTDEGPQKPRPKTQAKDDDSKYRKFPTATYNYFLQIDPILPFGEVNKKCVPRSDSSPDTPSITELSATSNSVSEAATDNYPVSEVAEIPIDNPILVTAELASDSDVNPVCEEAKPASE